MSQPPKVVLEVEVPPRSEMTNQARQLVESLDLQPGDFLTINPSGVIELVRQIHPQPDLLASALLIGALRPLFGSAGDAITHLSLVAVVSAASDARASDPGRPALGRVLPFRPRQQEG